MSFTRVVPCLETAGHRPAGALPRSEIDEPVFTELDGLISSVSTFASSHLPGNSTKPHGKQKVLHRDLRGLQNSLLNRVRVFQLVPRHLIPSASRRTLLFWIFVCPYSRASARPQDLQHIFGFTQPQLFSRHQDEYSCDHSSALGYVRCCCCCGFRRARHVPCSIYQSMCTYLTATRMCYKVLGEFQVCDCLQQRDAMSL